MLATLVDRDEPWEERDFAWELEVPDLSPSQRRVLAHAQRFSETMHGAALLYNRELAKAHENADLESDYRTALAEWAEDEQRADRDAVLLAEMWSLLGELGSRHSARTRRFVEDWCALASRPERVLSDPASLERVREREHEVKGRQARLIYDAARDTWRGAAGAGQLTYRWASTQRQLLDIVSVEES